MANTVSVRASLTVQFDTTVGGNTNLVTTPVTLLANRQFDVVDFNINVVAGNSDNNTAASGNTTRLTIDSITAAGAVTPLGTVTTSTSGASNPPAANAVGSWRRPQVSVIAGAAATVTDALIANALVPTGSSLRISAAANGTGVATTIAALGTLRILPGDRYGTTLVTDYYPNNSAALRA
jgi:hypothetical protein